MSKRTFLLATALAVLSLVVLTTRLANVAAQDNSQGDANLPSWRLRPRATDTATNPAPTRAAPPSPQSTPAPAPVQPAWAPTPATQPPPVPAATAEPSTSTETQKDETAQLEDVSKSTATPEPEPAVAPAAQAPVQIETPKQPAPPPPPAKQIKPVQMIPVMEFQNAPVNAVLDYYAKLTDRSIISAPNLGGVINFRSQTVLTRDEAITALDSMLAINNITVIPMGDKFLKVVQSATGKQEGPRLTPEGEALPEGDSFITQIIPLKFAEAQEVVGALQPYLHGYGFLMPLTKSNAILVTDTGNNINRMLEIVHFVDQPSALRMQTKVYVLKHAKAADVVQRLQSIIQETLQMGARPTVSAPTGQPATPRIPTRPGVQPVSTTAAGTGDESAIEGKAIITADDRTNKIFVMTRPSNFEFFNRLIAELDAKVDPDVIMKVLELDYANAEVMASQLSALITGGQATSTAPRRRTTNTGTTTRGAGAPVPPPPSAPVTTTVTGGIEASGFLQFAEGVRILADERTNSLLLMATKEDMARLEQLIKSMDTPVAQVLVEVVIAEVNLDGSLNVGVEAFKRLFNEGTYTMTGGYRTGQPNAPLDLTSLATNLGPLALSSGLTYFTTFNNVKLDTVVRLLATSSRFKVLSTPIIQTLHNQQASIIVGESRPVVTSTVADIASSSSTAVRSAVEYKDIAIELYVTPRINPDGYVTMDIEQKINDVGGSVTVNGTAVPIITKREAKSQVSVKDQSTIVLGGLIRENKTVSETKVPFLGDIPVLGTMFKGKTTTKNRTELIVFIRPTVLRTDTAAVAEARRRSKMLKAGEELELENKFIKKPAADEPATPKPDKTSTQAEDPAPAPEAN